MKLIDRYEEVIDGNTYVVEVYSDGFRQSTVRYIKSNSKPSPAPEPEPTQLDRIEAAVKHIAEGGNTFDALDAAYLEGYQKGVDSV